MTLHKESLAKLDPRTKLLLLIVVNIIVLNAYDYGNRLYIKFALFALTAGLLLCEDEVSAVVKGIIIYIYICTTNKDKWDDRCYSTCS